jgi:hypothetical protein
MSVELTSIEFKSPEVTDRTHARLMYQAMHKIASNHRLVTIGKHFKKNAETAVGGPYGYVARNPKYVSRKLAKFQTDVPNVRTGKLMRSVRNNSFVTATQSRSRLYIKGYFPLTDQRRKEITAITRAEIAEATQLGISTYQGLANKPENQRKRKKRIT